MIDDIVQPIAEPVPVKGKLHRITGKLGIGDIAFNGVAQLLLIFWALMVIFPFLWMIMTSFVNPSKCYSKKTPASPSSPTVITVPRLSNFPKNWLPM